MTKILGQSSHIYIRSWLENDTENWFQISQNSGLNKFSISGYRMSDVAAAEKFITEWNNVFKSDRTGIFPIFLKNTNEMTGICGLKKATFDCETSEYIEIMYRLSDDYWGKGYATEAVSILLRHAFNKLNLNQIIASIEKENLDSLKVLEKNRFKFQRSAKYHRKNVEIYSLDRDSFLKTSQIGVRRASERDLERVNDFYKRTGYSHSATGSDIVLICECDSSLIGAVRIVFESGEYVLRGMQIAPEFQGRGIGMQILSEIRPVLRNLNQSCYCVPYHHLERFYGQIGFQKTSEGPSFLEERVAKYNSTGMDVILMRYV
jgi:RimJ/RimL family protein N-acetyltransferase/N-acetylglutamate synthase-like GNAT family acetyltransferase